jgi:hypothetical protein
MCRPGGAPNVLELNHRPCGHCGAKFPPVVVFFDGTNHWLGDGFHRTCAAEVAGLKIRDQIRFAERCCRFC